MFLTVRAPARECDVYVNVRSLLSGVSNKSSYANIYLFYRTHNALC